MRKFLKRCWDKVLPKKDDNKDNISVDTMYSILKLTDEDITNISRYHCQSTSTVNSNNERKIYIELQMEITKKSETGEVK